MQRRLLLVVGTVTLYRPRIVHRDDRHRVLPMTQVAAKPRVKKVCKYVPARHVSDRQLVASR